LNVLAMHEELPQQTEPEELNTDEHEQHREQE
jgi:hypothetical protein